MTVEEFVLQYPNLAIDFSEPISTQPRILDLALLNTLPDELTPSYPYRSGSRGRPNSNQSLTHSQCATCKRVLRNDFFYTAPSMIRRNVLFSHCKQCAQTNNAERYDTTSSTIRKNQIEIWKYIAPSCLCCGFDQHSSAMDMHHVDATENQISALVSELAADPNGFKVEKLLRAAKKCIPLCSNCHRMLHAGIIDAQTLKNTTKYYLAELLTRLNKPGKPTNSSIQPSTAALLPNDNITR